MKDKLKKLLNEHVDYCRRQMRWDGENDAVIEKILELFNDETKRKRNDYTKRGTRGNERSYTQLG